MGDVPFTPTGADVTDLALPADAHGVHPDDCHVVRATGLIDHRWVADLVYETSGLRPGTRVIIDLSDGILVSQQPMEAALAIAGGATGDSDAVCVICSRVSGLMLLRRWGIARTTAVFTTVHDALQAELLRRDGFGNGWAVAGA